MIKMNSQNKGEGSSSSVFNLNSPKAVNDKDAKLISDGFFAGNVKVNKLNDTAEADMEDELNDKVNRVNLIHNGDQGNNENTSARHVFELERRSQASEEQDLFIGYGKKN